MGFLPSVATNTSSLSASIDLALFWITAFLQLCILLKVDLLSYNFYTICEHGLFLFLLFGEFEISFTNFISIKVLVSLGSYIVELIIYKLASGQGLSKLYYMLGAKSSICHAMVGVDGIDQQSGQGNIVLHYLNQNPAVDTVGLGGAVARSSKLTPDTHSRSFNELKDSVFFLQCVGFCIPNFNSADALMDLELCGKCQDWSIVAVYVLSCHKFLSYSLASFLRWLSWIGVLIVCAITIVVFMIGGKIEQDLLSDHDVQRVLRYVSDWFLMAVTLLDISNLKIFKIQDDRAVGVFRGRWLINAVKFGAVVAMPLYLEGKLPTYVRTYGYLWYAACCFFSAFVVTIVTWSPATRFFPSKPLQHYLRGGILYPNLYRDTPAAVVPGPAVVSGAALLPGLMHGVPVVPGPARRTRLSTGSLERKKY